MSGRVARIHAVRSLSDHRPPTSDSRPLARAADDERALQVLIVDDHPMFVEGMKPTLARLAEAVDVRTADSGEALRRLLDDGYHGEFVLLDLTLPDCEGWDLLALCLRSWPASRVVILSASERRADIRRALRLGAHGYLTKDASPELILSALRLALSGGLYVPAAVVDEWRDVLTSLPGEPPLADRVRELTGRQREVLQLIVDGCSNREIAERMGCCESTVKAHVTAVLKSLGVPNRVKAMDEARKLGWVRS